MVLTCEVTHMIMALKSVVAGWYNSHCQSNLLCGECSFKNTYTSSIVLVESRHVVVRTWVSV